MRSTTTIGRELEEGRNKLAQWLKENPTDETFTKAKAEELTKRNDELNALHDEFKASEAVEKIAAQNDAQLKELGERRPVVLPGDGRQIQTITDQPPKSLGRMVAESVGYKRYLETKQPQNFEIETKALEGERGAYTTGTGYGYFLGGLWAPQMLRSGVVVPFAMPQPKVVDLMPASPTTQAGIKYMEETTMGGSTTTGLFSFTTPFAGPSSATVVATATQGEIEAGTFPTAGLKLTERNAPVMKVGAIMSITDEQLDDVDGLAAYVDQRLMAQIRLRMDFELINGTGAIVTEDHLQGVYGLSGIQTQAFSNNNWETIFKGMQLVRGSAGYGYAEPSAVILHPTNWQTIRLASAAVGYLFGPPSDGGVERVWGIPVVQTTNIVVATGVLGDFANYSMLYYRTGINVEIGYVSGDFVTGRKSIRAAVRVAPVWYRPKAFCTLTALT
jgi:hypothetical protein